MLSAGVTAPVAGFTRIDPAAGAFGDPELIVGSPHDFPRRAQPARDDAERERRLRGDGLQNYLRQRDDDGECECMRCDLMLVLMFNLNSLLVRLLLRVQLVVVPVG